MSVQDDRLSADYDVLLNPEEEQVFKRVEDDRDFLNQLKKFHQKEKLFSFEIYLVLLFLLHRSEQYFTSSQTFSHFFRQENGLWQTMQILLGRLDFE